MRAKLTVLLAVAATLIAASVARAITYGEPDGNAHPYVGLVALYDDGVYKGRCSGTLISSTVVLTAAHCIAETNADSARVYFEPSVPRTQFAPETGAPTGGITGAPHQHEDFDGFATFPNTSDIGVVVLDAEVTDKGYGVLAARGFLDDKNGTVLTAVGYGAESKKQSPPSVAVRMRANPKVIDLNSSNTAGWNVKTSNNAKTGGTCKGDSGGPLLHGDSVVAVVSFGINGNCSGVDYSYRVDTAYAQSWLEEFLS